MTRDQQVPLTVITWKIRNRNRTALIWNRNPEQSNIFAYQSKIITTNNSKNNNWEWEAKIIKKFSKSGNSCFYRTFRNWLQISRQFRVNLYIRHFSLNQQHNDRRIFVDRNPHWIFLSEEGIQFFCCMDWQHIRVFSSINKDVFKYSFKYFSTSLIDNVLVVIVNPWRFTS